MAKDQQPQAARPSMAPGADERRAHARAIELVHLALMQVAATYLKPQDFAVKGGGNLRFVLRSGRRSADLDYVGGNFSVFGDRVEALMKGQALIGLLQLQNITLAELRLPKNTETTKRWKFMLSRPGMQPASSKVEFSNRASTQKPVLGQV